MKEQAGQSLFEIIFATAIAAVVMVGVVALSTESVRNANYSQNKALASRYAQEASEWLREERDSDWVGFVSPGNEGVSCLGTLSWSASCDIPNTQFERRVVLNFNPPWPALPESVDATVYVTWQDGQGLHEVRVVTRLTNWR